MAKKKANKKKKNAIDIKRILVLVFGSAAVVSLLFIAGYLFDYLARSFIRVSSPNRFSILGMRENIGETDDAGKNDSAAFKSYFLLPTCRRVYPDSNGLTLVNVCYPMRLRRFQNNTVAFAQNIFFRIIFNLELAF